MSNPAVKILDEQNNRFGKFKRFQIEDNIGESIHLHIDNMRVDFTINEYLDFSNMIRDSLVELDILKGFDINNFDEKFLSETSKNLKNLIDIKIEEITLSELKFVVNSSSRRYVNFKYKYTISQLPAYKYLKQLSDDFKNYSQYNYLGIDNESRIKCLLDSIKENKYPYNENYIILFNNENYVRDGQHRAAILAHLYGQDKKIKIIRFYFSNNKHRINLLNTNLKILLEYGFRMTIKIAKKILR
jgi:hypothetical protein